MAITRRFILQAGGALSALTVFNALSSTPFSSGEKQPVLDVPEGSVDCHMHLYNDRYPAAPGASLRPANASLADYHQLQTRLGLRRMVIVTPSTYGTDNRLLIEGLRQSGGQARGVAVVDASVSDAELQEMDRQGVRGIRFNLSRGETSLDSLEPLASRIAPLGWHIQVVAPGEKLAELASRLRALPTKLVIDHMGHVPQPEGTKAPCFQTLTRLLDAGNTWIKLSGPYIKSRIGPPGYEDVGQVAAELVRRRPDRLLWGSDWPHPTKAENDKPDDAAMLDLLAHWAPSSADRLLILRDNPSELYGFDHHAHG